MPPSKKGVDPNSTGAGNLVGKITTQTISNEVLICCQDNYMVLSDQLTNRLKLFGENNIYAYH